MKPIVRIVKAFDGSHRVVIREVDLPIKMVHTPSLSPFTVWRFIQHTEVYLEDPRSMLLGHLLQRSTKNLNSSLVTR